MCTKAPEEVSSAATTEMDQNICDIGSKGKRSAASAEMAEADSEERAKSMKQQVLPGTGPKSLAVIKADNSVSDFFDGTATAHSIVDSFFFRKMIEDIQAAGPG